MSRLVTITLFGREGRQIINRPAIVLPPTRPGSPFGNPLVFDFALTGLPAGRYVLQAQFPGFVVGIKEVRVEPPPLLLKGCSCWEGSAGGWKRWG